MSNQKNRMCMVRGCKEHATRNGNCDAHYMQHWRLIQRTKGTPDAVTWEALAAIGEARVPQHSGGQESDHVKQVRKKLEAMRKKATAKPSRKRRNINAA